MNIFGWVVIKILFFHCNLLGESKKRSTLYMDYMRSQEMTFWEAFIFYLAPDEDVEAIIDQWDKQTVE